MTPVSLKRCFTISIDIQMQWSSGENLFIKYISNGAWLTLEISSLPNWAYRDRPQALGIIPWDGAASFSSEWLCNGGLANCSTACRPEFVKNDSIAAQPFRLGGKSEPFDRSGHDKCVEVPYENINTYANESIWVSRIGFNRSMWPNNVESCEQYLTTFLRAPSMTVGLSLLHQRWLLGRPDKQPEVKRCTYLNF